MLQENAGSVDNEITQGEESEALPQRGERVEDKPQIGALVGSLCGWLSILIYLEELGQHHYDSWSLQANVFPLFYTNER